MLSIIYQNVVHQHDVGVLGVCVLGLAHPCANWREYNQPVDMGFFDLDYQATKRVQILYFA